MSDNVWIALIAAIPGIIAALASLRAVNIGKSNAGKLDQIHAYTLAKKDVT